MPDPDAQRTKKVSESAIGEIRKLGMSKAIKKYTSGEGTPEFRTAIERYYSPQRLKSASNEATKPKPREDTGGKAKASVGDKSPVQMPKSAPAAAGRRSKPTGSGVLGEKNTKAVGNAAAPVGRLLASLGSGSKGISGQGGKAVKSLGSKFGVSNPFKPRKRK